MVPRALLMKFGLVLVNTARQVNAAHSKTIVNAARPMTNLSKSAHSTVKRPIHKNTAFKNSNFNHRVNTVKDKNVNTVKPKAVVNAARPKAVVNAVKGNNVNSVKASACWDKEVIDSGCSRHMTGNMSYLVNYEEIDGGYVAFGGNPKEGKITGRAQAEMGEGLANPTNSHHTPTIIQPSISQPQRKQRHRKPKRKDTKVPQPSGPTTNVEDKAVYKEMDDSLVRAATTSSSLEAECQETIGDTYARTRFERVSKLSNDPLFARGNTLQSSEDSLKLKELIELCTNVQNRVIDLENTTGDYKFETKISTTVDAAQVSTTVTITPEEITLAQALQDLKAAKPKDKGQAKMIELKPVKKLSKKDQLKLYEEVAQRLQAEFHEQVRIERKKVEKEAEANIALKETWDDIQAKIEADQRKLFAAKRAEEKRNRPPTRAQQRSIMSTYLKNMAGYKHNQLKNKSINDIQKLFNKAMKRVNAFVDMDIELVEGSSKRARTELEKEEIKKQKVDDVQETAKVDKDKEIAELKSLMKVIPGEEEVAVDVIPLATKPPSIVDYKILKEGKISYFQIIRADGSSKRYSAFI
ncbi:hypothetical protein Tco_0993381 [Tanacetum coccineum]|uniref:Retrovirus-related Pol polyprotein from transposon TNT 1-94-like beta-barrel domain-containing protein n=1 Tax=Tanacetum coccineum TaxID=301880 RepID=A0ABQ5F6X9_9ASTR